MPNKILSLFRRGVNGDDERENIAVKNGALRFDNFGKAFAVPANTTVDNFELIPAASATAGKDPFFLVAGTGTEIIGRATKGGLNLTTQSTTPADDDNVFIAAVAETGMSALLNSKSLPRLSGVFSVPVITGLFGFVGIEQNASDADPSGTAGDGVGICFAPDGAAAMTVATGLSAGAHANLLIHYKVGGADTFLDTGVKLVAAQDYAFVIEFGEDLKAKVYIDGRLIATTAALTTATTLRTFAGVEVTGTAIAQKQIEVRNFVLERTVG